MQLKHILYDWDGLNTTLFYAVNRHGHALDSLMLLGTKLGNYKLFPIYLMTIAAFMCLRSLPHKARSASSPAGWRALCIETLLVLCIAYACSCIWVPLLKNGFHFTRPFAALPAGTVTIADAVRQGENPNASFPSGHSEFAMLIIAGMWPVLRGTGKALGALFFIWVAFSRLYLGVHFPADVLYSALLSLGFVLIIRQLVRRIMIIKMIA